MRRGICVLIALALCMLLCVAQEEDGAAATVSAAEQPAQPLGDLMNNGLKGVKGGARLVAQGNYPLTSDNVFTTDTKGAVIDGAGYKLKQGRQSNSFWLSIPRDLTLENFGIEGIGMYGGTLTLRNCLVQEGFYLSPETFYTKNPSIQVNLENTRVEIEDGRLDLYAKDSYNASLYLDQESVLTASMYVNAGSGSRVSIVNDGQMDVGESRFNANEGGALTYSGSGSVTGDQLSIGLWEGATVPSMEALAWKNCISA